MAFNAIFQDVKHYLEEKKEDIMETRFNNLNFHVCVV